MFFWHSHHSFYVTGGHVGFALKYSINLSIVDVDVQFKFATFLLGEVSIICKLFKLTLTFEFEIFFVLALLELLELELV